MSSDMEGITRQRQRPSEKNVTLQDLPADVMLNHIATKLDATSICRLMVAVRGVRNTLRKAQLLDTRVLSNAICSDIQRFDGRQEEVSNASFFVFRKNSPGVRCAELQWLTMEQKGLSNLAGASVFSIAERIAHLRINRQTAKATGCSPSQLPYVKWIMAWLCRYASHIPFQLVNFLRGIQNVVHAGPTFNPQTSRAQIGMLQSLDAEYMLAVLNYERVYLKMTIAANLSEFELLANSIIESSSSIKLAIKESISSAMIVLANPQQEFKLHTGQAQSWHVFACNFGAVCRWFMELDADIQIIRSSFQLALEELIGKATRTPETLVCKRYAFHGLELCHWACVYGIHFDIEKFLPMLLRINKRSGHNAKRFIAQWLLNTENSSPRARGQILLAEYPRVLDEILEWIQS